jgi:Leucine-rich repeat (LRR) protein
MHIVTIFIIALFGGLTFIGTYLVDMPEKEVSTGNSEDTTVEVRIADDNIQGIKVLSNTIEVLDYSNQSLTEVPSDLFKETTATTLNISGNHLDGAFPAEVRHLQNIQFLNLSDNNFTGVPAEIGQLKNLEVLDLSDNPITGLPLELGNLKNLQVLDLRGTQYSEYDLKIIKESLPQGVIIKI